MDIASKGNLGKKEVNVTNMEVASKAEDYIVQPRRKRRAGRAVEGVDSLIVREEVPRDGANKLVISWVFSPFLLEPCRAR